MKIRFCAALLLAALILSGCNAEALSPEATQPVLSVMEDPTVPLAPVPAAEAPAVSTEAPTAPAQASAVPAETPMSPPNSITADEAIAIALADAGLTEDQVTRLHAEFDYDDGRPEYEVEFRKDGFEYSYDIHAESGRILSRDKDRDD